MQDNSSVSNDMYTVVPKKTLQNRIVLAFCDGINRVHSWPLALAALGQYSNITDH